MNYQGYPFILYIAAPIGGTNHITNPSSTGSYEITVTGTYGDDQAEGEVPIVTNDQVTLEASVDTYISFNVTTSSGSDNNIDLGELKFSSVTSSNDSSRTNEAGSTLAADNVSLTLDTNAFGGSNIGVVSLNAGLTSSSKSYTLTSATETLAVNQNSVSNTAGYGLHAVDASTTSGTINHGTGSPFSSATANAVGNVTTSFQNIYSTTENNASTSPIVGGTASVYVLAVPAKNTPAADDYADTLTFRANSKF